MDLQFIVAYFKIYKYNINKANVLIPKRMCYNMSLLRKQESSNSYKYREMDSGFRRNDILFLVIFFRGCFSNCLYLLLTLRSQSIFNNNNRMVSGAGTRHRGNGISSTHPSRMTRTLQQVIFIRGNGSMRFWLSNTFDTSYRL